MSASVLPTASSRPPGHNFCGSSEHVSKRAWRASDWRNSSRFMASIRYIHCHTAAEKCDVEGLRGWLTPNSLEIRPVDAVHADGLTALHVLCGANYFNAARYTDEGRRNAETVETCFHLLREAGADLEARDPFGRTALHIVVRFASAFTSEYEARVPGIRRDSLLLASLLLRHGVDVNATDTQYHHSPLHIAVYRPSMAALLVKAGADVNLPDRDGQTPLYNAILHADKWRDASVRGTLPILLRAGAEISDDVREALSEFGGPGSDDDDDLEAVTLYFQKVIDAGGFKRYEQAHLAALTATFAPKFPMLPPEMVRHILTFGFHAGFY